MKATFLYLFNMGRLVGTMRSFYTKDLIGVNIVFLWP
jgi:hypothetical protein